MSDKAKIQEEIRKLRLVYLELRKQGKPTDKIAKRIYELNDKLVK
ncbi:hypothetical protein SEA_EVY_30 [Streptomyces phage Evy]|uniref:Uncharacterized protein n=2 Tax=Samistivirus TaxID=2560220 RepID=A0A0A0RKQ9_9CAUD|nr:hypothetical protein AXJ18_gp032 [Streptomyces phage Jay2Jay]YP_010103407.1 hypothetical protein KNU67_gp029 [Streptomyces phage Evy]AIW02531.1 hypothetical protein PBI_JAY2JAY_32 [Streptomyces phage Jay2Jay]QDH93898.1 hypothetical protein SEA_EVY_30 [Streptomyces phage Evy]UEM46818.1 hypothetical protein SEA_TARGARYEN_29 [Streptomyces phage Targaryen]